MSGVYFEDGTFFLDSIHLTNYMNLRDRWKQAKIDPEYQVPVYILAIPMIYRKVEKHLDGFTHPVDWIWRWEYKHTVGKDVKNIPDVPYDLSGSMVQLGKFALNMWNGYEHFNLMKCMNVLDSSNFEVLKCAIRMRNGDYMHSKIEKIG